MLVVISALLQGWQGKGFMYILPLRICTVLYMHCTLYVLYYICTVDIFKLENFYILISNAFLVTHYLFINTD